MKGNFSDNEKNNKLSGMLGKKLARNTNFAVLIAAVVVIAILLNLVLEVFPLNIDLTAEGLYSLTETTEKVLDELEGDVTIYALYDRIEGEDNTSKAQVIKVLDLYDSKSSKVKVEYIDLDRRPAFLKELVGETSASQYAAGDYIVKHGDRVRRVDADDVIATTTTTQNYIPYEYSTGLQAETKFTSAILKVFSDVPVIYYSTGFNELPRELFSRLLSYVDASGFDVKEIDLKSQNFEENAVAIMFLGPKQDLTGEAQDKLNSWLENGHDAFFFMDILNLEADNAYIYNNFENFSELFGKYGIKMLNSVVEESEKNSVASEVDKIFITDTITAGALDQMPNTQLYVSNTRKLDIDKMADMAEPEVILSTSEDATATSIEDESVHKGKQTVGVSSRYTGGREVSNIAVFGSSYTFYDTMLAYAKENALYMIQNILSWMNLEVAKNVGDSIEAKDYNSMSSIVEVTEKEVKTIALVVALIIPLVILAVGIVVWFRRRHL